jgi:hypothetical protein
MTPAERALLDHTTLHERAILAEQETSEARVISADERADYARQEADARWEQKHRHDPAYSPEDDAPDTDTEDDDNE